MHCVTYLWFISTCYLVGHRFDVYHTNIDFVFFLWRCGPTRARASSFLRFLDHAQRRTTVGRTSLDEWSVRRRDLYLTTHNNHNRRTSVPPAGFELTISASERPQTYAFDRAATGTGIQIQLPATKQVSHQAVRASTQYSEILSFFGHQITEKFAIRSKALNQF